MGRSVRVLAGFALWIALVASGLGAGPALAAEAITQRAPDAFYDAPPVAVPRPPGTLIRSERLTGVTLPPYVQAWRILYATTIDDRTPATAVALVFAPTQMQPGPRPVITWEHATTGLVQRCMPSLSSAPMTGIPAAAQAIGAGWVIVATDYAFAEKDGPHPYLIGEGEARSALDATRAARRIPDLNLSARTVIWGHAQGGHGALWTGSVGPRYAPELEIAGVAAIAPIADIATIARATPELGKRLAPYAAKAYSRFYPEVGYEGSLRPKARAAAEKMAQLCSGVPAEAQQLQTLSNSYQGTALAIDTNPALASRLLWNAVHEPIEAPLLIVQGSADTVVPPKATDRFVNERCGGNPVLDYWTFPGRDHRNIVEPGGPLDEPLIAWTNDRFAGDPRPEYCVRETF